MRRVRWGVLVVVLAAVITMVSPAAEAAPGRIPVVAAEDFWGSIARQLGGDHVDVKSVIDDPETHAHDYEPKPSDGAAFARAKVAIVNGIGYDPWAAELLEANPSSGRKVLTVGDVVGVKEGANPHQWYSPGSVDRMIDAITDAYKQADPANAAAFDSRRQSFRTEALRKYNELRAAIRAQFDGTAVGATESIFAPLADDLGLKVLTPWSFQEAIAEGQDPTAADKATVDQQIVGKQIKVLIYNAQNSTPDVAALVAKADKAGIPVTTVTETPNPKGALFQDWQADQLHSLADALAKATGKPVAPTPPAPPAATAASGASALAADLSAVPPGSSAPAAAHPAAARPAASASAPASGERSAAPEMSPSALARTGPEARWPLRLAGTALLLGGLGVAGGAGRRRQRSSIRSA